MSTADIVGTALAAILVTLVLTLTWVSGRRAQTPKDRRDADSGQEPDVAGGSGEANL